MVVKPRHAGRRLAQPAQGDEGRQWAASRSKPQNSGRYAAQAVKLFHNKVGRAR